MLITRGVEGGGGSLMVVFSKDDAVAVMEFVDEEEFE